MKSSIPLPFGTKTQADYSFSKSHGSIKFVCPIHWHDCFEIIWVKKGKFGVKTSDGDTVLSENDTVLFPPCTLHGTYSVDEEYCVNVFGYTNSLIYSPEISFDNKKFLTPFFINTNACFVHHDHEMSEELLNCLSDVIKAYDRNDITRELNVRGKILNLHACLYSIVTKGSENTGTSDRYILDTERYIESHITENISPYEIADSLHISYSHFARIVHSHYGCSANELITHMKISYAEQLMTADISLGITEIAMAVGYNSASYFSRRFRQIRGCSPSEFRRLLNSDRGSKNTAVISV